MYQKPAPTARTPAAMGTLWKHGVSTFSPLLEFHSEGGGLQVSLRSIRAAGVLGRRDLTAWATHVVHVLALKLHSSTS